ncbi:MAG: hypothetical protein AB7F65_10975 [Dehalococcoidia bacterium]
MSNEHPMELCGEAGVESIAGTAYVQKWWSHREHAELLRFGRVAAEAGAPAEDELVSDAQLVGLLDSAWTNGVLSDFAKRQIFHMVMRQYEADPASVWAIGPQDE